MAANKAELWQGGIQGAIMNSGSRAAKARFARMTEDEKREHRRRIGEGVRRAYAEGRGMKPGLKLKHLTPELRDLYKKLRRMVGAIEARRMLDAQMAKDAKQTNLQTQPCPT